MFICAFVVACMILQDLDQQKFKKWKRKNPGQILLSHSLWFFFIRSKLQNWELGCFFCHYVNVGLIILTTPLTCAYDHYNIAIYELWGVMRKAGSTIRNTFGSSNFKIFFVKWTKTEILIALSFSLCSLFKPFLIFFLPLHWIEIEVSPLAEINSHVQQSQGVGLRANWPFCSYGQGQQPINSLV